MILNEINQALSNKEIFAIFFFIIGACLGSFFNVVSFRYLTIIENENAREITEWLKEKGLDVPIGISSIISEMNLSFPASHCYSCKTKIKWYHNIPILGFVFLGGKCAFCKTKLSWQYPVIELLGGLLLASVYCIFFTKGGLWLFLLATFFFMVCFVLLVIDFRTMFLPDSLNFALIWIGLLSSINGVSIGNISLKESIIALCIGYSILWIFSFVGRIIKGVEVMGGGDLKLVAALGVFVGIPGVLFTIFASPFIGIFFWLYSRMSGEDEPQFPFGPALIIAAWVYLFYGKEILNWLGIVI